MRLPDPTLLLVTDRTQGRRSLPEISSPRHWAAAAVG